jgi:hypothetical protein
MKKAALVISSTLALAGAVAVPSALGSAKSSQPVGPKVTVEVKTRTKTLLGPTSARGRSGWVTKGGTPTGKCSAASAAGALTTATHGRWTGKYYSGIGIFITSILSVKPHGSDYWAIWVNGRFSTKGLCDIKLRAGERLLFQIKK